MTDEDSEDKVDYITEDVDSVHKNQVTYYGALKCFRKGFGLFNPMFGSHRLYDNDDRSMKTVSFAIKLLGPSKTGTCVKYPYCGDTYQYALLEPSKTGTYVKYPYRRLHGSSTLVTLPA